MTTDPASEAAAILAGIIRTLDNLRTGAAHSGPGDILLIPRQPPRTRPEGPP